MQYARPYLPFRDPGQSLRDIADAINLIKQFTAGMDFHAFREDPKTIAAVERKLLMISEAAIRLGDEAEIRCPGIPWRDIRGIGNWLRHQYDAIELPVVWKTVRDSLSPLEAAVLRALEPPPSNSVGVSSR